MKVLFSATVVGDDQGYWEKRGETYLFDYKSGFISPAATPVRQINIGRSEMDKLVDFNCRIIICELK